MTSSNAAREEQEPLLARGDRVRDGTSTVQSQASSHQVPVLVFGLRPWREISARSSPHRHEPSRGPALQGRRGAGRAVAGVEFGEHLWSAADATV
ncbi:hypothetical protein MBR_09289, partial [Metarhizium brunneum ARSEF 3297]